MKPIKTKALNSILSKNLFLAEDGTVVKIQSCPQNIASVLDVTVKRMIKRYGEGFWWNGLCDVASRSFSRELKKQGIKHLCVFGGDCKGIGWHCWVEIPRHGIFDLTFGQSCSNKSRPHPGMILGVKTGIYYRKYDKNGAKVKKY